MEYETDIPPPIAISDVIRGLPINQSVYIGKQVTAADSVRSLISRIKAEAEAPMAFKTAADDGGIRVWRVG